MRALSPLAGLPALMLAVGCLEPNPYAQPCYFHCWEYTVTVPDEDSDDNFDTQCVNHWTNFSMQVPVPPNGVLLARACLPSQVDHELVSDAVTALENTTDVSMAEAAAWSSLVSLLGQDVVTQCRQHATGSPGFQDIDPGVGGSQACTEMSSDAVCDVLAMQVQQALSLEDGSPSTLPSYAGAEYGTTGGKKCDFEPDFSDTGRDVDPASSTSEGAADSTGSFGDIDPGIDCFGQRCTVTAEVVSRILAGFSQFYRDEARLTIVDAGRPCNSRGAILSGLEPGEESFALAKALTLRNGDIIAAVEGIPIVDTASGERVLEMVRASSSPVDVTVRRRQNSSSCVTVNYTFEVVP